MDKKAEINENREMLALWKKAEKAITTGQEYTINGRTLRRVDAKLILERIEYYEDKIKRLERGHKGNITARRAIIRDN